MFLQPNNTHRLPAQPHTRSRCGMYPGTPIQCQCSVLSPPTSGWSPCQFTCQGWTSRALSAPERPPLPPPIHTHFVTWGQGGFTHSPVASLPSIALCHPCASLDIPRSVNHSQYKCYICTRLLPAAFPLICSGVAKGVKYISVLESSNKRKEKHSISLILNVATYLNPNLHFLTKCK